MWQPFTEEHEQFRKTVRSFAEKELFPNAEEWERDEIFPSWVFKRAGELGILGAHFPEEHGGMGLDYWFSVAKAEELPHSRLAGVNMGLLVQSDMATPVISDIGSKEQIDEFLRPALAGDKIAALGVSEPAAGSDVAGILTTARKDGDDYVIHGSKTFITNGTRADFVTMLVKTAPERGAHGCSFFLVPTNLPGFPSRRSSRRSATSRPTRPSSSSTTCACPSATCWARRTWGSCTSCRTSRRSASSRLSAPSPGASSRWTHTIEYGRDRKAFGKPIIKREVWQHKFVDLYTKLEAAKAFNYRVVDQYNDERYVRKVPLSMDTVKLISMTKILSGDILSEVTDSCLQFHGGWGYIEDFPIARAWRDQRLLRIGGGTTETMKYYLAKLMGF
jgi:citronellyl-CoA dehydrogenase